MWIKALATFLILSQPAIAERLLVFAAASLKGPLDEIADQDITVAYAGSGTIARQIMQDAPADVVILANSQWMDVLAENAKIAADTRQTILSNGLVLVSATLDPFDLSAQTLSQALGAGRLAIGRTNSVPAGIYAKEALQTLGLWDSAAPHLAEVDNVRAALILAERGEVPLALVYASDAASSDAVHVVAEIPQSSHAVIRYEAAATAGSSDANTFLERLTNTQIFEQAGFLPPPTD